MVMSTFGNERLLRTK